MQNLLFNFKICRSPQCFFYSKIYLHIQVTYLLIRFNKTKSFQWNTKNIYRNGVNSKTHTPHTHTEKISYLVLVSDILFLEQPLYFTKPSFFYSKILHPSFLRKFWKLPPPRPPPIFIKRGQVPNMDYLKVARLAFTLSESTIETPKQIILWLNYVHKFHSVL